jgi:methyl-accepting chemotaxis protein WspA
MSNRFSHLKLRDRTLLGYAVPTLLIFGFSGLVYVTASKTLETLKQLNTSQSTVVNNDAMTLRITNMDRRIRRHLMTGDQDSLNLFQQDQTIFNESVELVRRDTMAPEQHNRLREMTGLRDQLYSIAQQTIDTAKKEGGASKGTQATYITNSLRITNQFEQLSKAFQENAQSESQRNVDALKSTISVMTASAIVTSVLSAIAAILSTSMIANALGDRVGKVVIVAEQISLGNLRQSIDNTTNTKDEVGQLLGSFQAMIQQLNKLLNQVQRSSIQVTTSCTQLAASGRQLEGTITEQVASTNQVSSTAKQIAATSEELVNTIEEVVTLSQTTAQTANVQQQELTRMGGNMQQLASATDSISAKLGTISEKANNINTIVATITKVADQTNLLSLNAAIEAEKAGEYGLGFAVVAKEIRRLADQTAISTVDIEQMIKEMQSAVSTGVMEMDKFAREVRQGVDEVSRITGQVGEMIEQVQELSPRFEVVSQGMEMQFQGAQQISEAMMQLSSTSSQTADSLQEINHVIEQLNHAEQSLRQEVMRFKTEDVSAVGTPELAMAR